MYSVKKLFSGFLAVSIGLVAIALSAALYAIAPPSLQPVPSQTQNPQQQELEKLQEQGAQQLQQGKFTEALAKFQQALTLTRQLQDKKTAAITLNNIGYVYSSIGQPQKALEFYNQALPIRNC